MQSYEHTGIQSWEGEHGIRVMRLHYEADPEKGGGEKTFVPELNIGLSPWALGEYKNMTNRANYLQEYEIDAEATQGRKIFNLDDDATLEMSFPIPPDWTRRMALDPHPSVPHAFLWCATDPYGDRYYYRELWPSRACYMWENGKAVGKPGPVPEDEMVITTKDYIESLKYLESADNPENEFKEKRFDEDIFARVIDYSARAFGKGDYDTGEQTSVQKRYEALMILPALRLSCPYFEDAKKDHEVGFEMVNAGLKVRMVEGDGGKMIKSSRIHIFKDRCPELVYQLRNNRRQVLTPRLRETQDPTGKMVEVRKHCTDCLRYLEMANPIYINPHVVIPKFKPQIPGIAW